jgi:hypothetical protein
MKTKKNYTAQSRNGGGVRHVNLIRVTMPSGGFEVQGYSPPRCVLHPVAVLSIFLSSPPHHLLHLLIFFCTPASCIPCRCHATFAGVLYVVVLSPSLVFRVLAHRCHGVFCLVIQSLLSGCAAHGRNSWTRVFDGHCAAHGERGLFPLSSFTLWDTMPASYFLVAVRRRVGWLSATPGLGCFHYCGCRWVNYWPSRWSLRRQWVLSGAQSC